MKKQFLLVLTCIIFLFSSICAGATDVQDGLTVAVNGVETGYRSVYSGNTYYVPIRAVFEKMGASVFYRDKDSQILALSRDGDIIRHIVGTNVITVNGEEKTFENGSVSKNYTTYIPVEMLTPSLCPDGISYDSGRLNIQKYFFNSDFNKIIKDVLDVQKSSCFYPERFQRYISYHVKMPELSMEDVLLKVNIGLDYPFYENVSIIEQPYELLVLVNKYNGLPSGFTQHNLVEMERDYRANDGRTYLLAGVAYENYVQMADAAREDGLSMRVVSAYRTEDYQRNLFNKRVRTTGQENADTYTARAGHSEHQTGLAVDISSTLASFEHTAEFKWLQNHAHEYGFILRYPKGKEWITGYGYEPWHYRYVGTEAAKIIYEEGITYEEFYAKYMPANEFK